MHANEIPEGWAVYQDDDAVPYYYNASTGENTYDHPIAKNIKKQVIETRALHEGIDEQWQANISDYWMCFGGDRVTYYNLRTRKTQKIQRNIAIACVFSLATPRHLKH